MEWADFCAQRQVRKHFPRQVRDLRGRARLYCRRDQRLSRGHDRRDAGDGDAGHSDLCRHQHALRCGDRQHRARGDTVSALHGADHGRRRQGDRQRARDDGRRGHHGRRLARRGDEPVPPRHAEAERLLVRQHAAARDRRPVLWRGAHAGRRLHTRRRCRQDHDGRDRCVKLLFRRQDRHCARDRGYSDHRVGGRERRDCAEHSGRQFQDRRRVTRGCRLLQRQAAVDRQRSGER